MINLDKVKNIYVSHEYTDMRKQVDGLLIMIQTILKLDPFEPSLFVFCNKGKNRLKILHFDNGFWLYYHRLEKGRFKWPDKEGLFNISFEELKWFINGHELRLEKRKFESLKNLIYTKIPNNKTIENIDILSFF